nr:hypothetical protein [Tanacetum cinerariifolium]
MLPLGEHSYHWDNFLGESVREFPMHFGSWRSILPERKAGVLGKIGTQFDLKPHMQSELWPEIRKGVDQHLGKIYTDNKPSLKRDYRIRFWSDPKNMAGGAQNARNRAKSTVMQSSTTQEYSSLIQTFFDTHIVGGVFLSDEDRRLYVEMMRLQGLGTYTDDQIMAMVRGGKQRGYIPSVGRVLARRDKDVLDVPAMSSDDRYSQLFTQLQSQHKSGSDVAGGDESGDDEDADEDEEDANSQYYFFSNNFEESYSEYQKKGEEKSAKDNAISDDSIEKHDRSDAVVPLKEVKKENEDENKTKYEPVKSAKNKFTQTEEEESVKAPNSQPVLKIKI